MVGHLNFKELLTEKEKNDRKTIEAKNELGWKKRRMNALKEFFGARKGVNYCHPESSLITGHHRLTMTTFANTNCMETPSNN